MLIPEAKVQEILERTDIVGLIGSRVELKRAGHSLKGLCPFHGERTPSFIVTPERRRFKCFGCGAGGDAISFVMKQGGKSFVEAAKELAAAAGVRLDDAGDDKLQREKLNQRRVHQLATRFFMEQLWDPHAGQAARTFLKKRGLTADSVKRFQLGYAPDAWDGFSKRAAKEGMLELALSAGLVNERAGAAPASMPAKAVAQAPAKRVAPAPAKTVAPAPAKTVAPAPAKTVAPAPVPAKRLSGTYDFFRGRLMIPIRSSEGATVAFGGRILGGDDPRKFVNSRESFIYKKGELLYGIDQAGPTIRKTGQALLVEGYFDAIVLYQAGITNAVALCSASLTAEQVKLLRRFEAQEIVLILDGDDAGRRGVTRAAAALLATAMPTRVVVLPTGADPDDHVLEVGGDAFKREIAAAQPLTEHLIQSALPKNQGASFEARLKGLAELKPILAQVPQGLERALFITSLSERLGVPEATLTKALSSSGLQAGVGRQPPGASQGAPNRTAAAPRNSDLAKAGSSLPARSRSSGTEAGATGPSPLLTEEALLLAHLIHDPELARLPQAEEIEALMHQGLRAAAAALTEAVLDGTPLPKSELLAALDPEVRRRVDDLLLRVIRQSPQAHREEFLQRCALHREHLARTEAEELQHHLKELAQRIADLKRRDQGGVELDALIDEHLRLTQEKQAFSRARRERTASAVH